MLNREEYNEVFSCNLSQDDFDKLMSIALDQTNIRNIDHLSFVDAKTHEVIVFSRVDERRDEVAKKLQARVDFLQKRLCEWCAVCPEERRNPDDCELIGESL